MTLNDKVLPFFDGQNIRVLRVLTDNGVEYCGRQDVHSCELYLHLNGIEHTRIRIRRPQTNGSFERLNQTVQQEFYQVAFRKKLYETDGLKLYDQYVYDLVDGQAAA